MPDWEHSPEAVRRYAQDGMLESWVHQFLTTGGKNGAMAAGLRLQPRFWAGPVQIPFARLAPALGVDEGFEFVVPRESFEHRVTAMVAALRAGWAPPPLIAQYRPGGTLSIRDGNHRYWALQRSGIAAYWCVFWCDSAELQHAALAEFAAAPQ